jgi:hypothetical protein
MQQGNYVDKQFQKSFKISFSNSILKVETQVRTRRYGTLII